MIYNHNIITKEQKQAFVERKESRNKIFFYGIIVALLTFSLHFMLQTLTRSVLSTALPQLMMPSYFSMNSLFPFLSPCHLFYQKKPLPGLNLLVRQFIG